LIDLSRGAGPLNQPTPVSQRNNVLGDLHMLINMLGCTGQGLVWGWLIGSLGRLRYRSNILTLIITTLLLASEVILFAGWPVLALFLGAVVLALLLHLAWYYYLDRRFRSLEKLG